MKTLLLTLSFTIALLPFSHAQSGGKSCADLKSGEYYYYPKNSTEQNHFIFSGNTVKQMDMKKKKDSIVYKLEWKDECSFTLKYVESNGLSDDDLQVLTKHKLAYKVDSIGADYYLFDIYLDKVSGEYLGKDTMWMHPKENYKSNVLFVSTDPNKIRKLRFTDTSQVALLYIYRPGKLKLSFSDLFLFYDNIAMAVLKNKSAAVFALYKEGTFNLKSRISATKVEGDLPLDVKFGKKYYIRADMIWGLYKTGNTKLEFTIMDPKEGKDDFEAIYQQ